MIGAVITTYGAVALDFGSDNAETCGPLSRVKWRRLVLDEAHTIRNPSSKIFQAVLRVNALYRWCLTATPLQNKPRDLHPLFAVINTEVFSDRRQFGKYITTPIREQKAEGFLRLRTLMMENCLRRTKELIELPSKTVINDRLLLTDTERLVYKAFDSQALELFEELQNLGMEVVSQKFQFLLIIILRLRQLCDHVALCKDIERFFVDARSAICSGGDYVADRDLVAEQGCCCCDGSSNTMYICACSHTFCEAHISDVQEAAQCPLCQEPLERGDIWSVTLTATRRKRRLKLSRDEAPSTKMVRVLDLVQGVKSAGGKGARTVVFSQFTEFLDILEDFLHENGLTTTRIDGTMTRDQKDMAIVQFNQGLCDVILARSVSGAVYLLFSRLLESLHAAGVGINLAQVSEYLPLLFV